MDRALLRLSLDNITSTNDPEYDILLQINSLGAWILKFRNTGLIINNRLIYFAILTILIFVILRITISFFCCDS